VPEILALLQNIALFVSDAHAVAAHPVNLLCQLQRSKEGYIAAGDEVVFGKAGKETYGIGCFFSSLQNFVIPGLSFFVFPVIHVKARQPYPIQEVQMVKERKENKKKTEKKQAKRALS